MYEGKGKLRTRWEKNISLTLRKTCRNYGSLIAAQYLVKPQRMYNYSDRLALHSYGLYLYSPLTYLCLLSIFVGSLLEIDSFVQNIDRVVHAMISFADARFIKLNEWILRSSIAVWLIIDNVIFMRRGSLDGPSKHFQIYSPHKQHDSAARQKRYNRSNH